MEIPVLKKLYDEKYGRIPDDADDRLHFLISSFKSNKWEEQFLPFIQHISKLKWKKETFTFYVIPKATPRPRGFMRGRNVHFYVKGADDHKKFIKFYLKNREDIELIQTSVKFDCKVFLPIPSTMRSVEQLAAELGFIRPMAKPDWDNLAKTYCDMINDVIIADDKNIVEGRLRKYYSIKPRIEITLEYLEDFDSDFNRKKCIER